MTRRNQSHRRRTYGRRQHEVRERRPDERPAEGWLGGTDVELDTEFQTADTLDDRTTYGESFGGFSR